MGCAGTDNCRAGKSNIWHVGAHGVAHNAGCAAIGVRISGKAVTAVPAGVSLIGDAYEINQD